MNDISNVEKKNSMHEDLNNESLFTENSKGNYTYDESKYGKSASGNLELNKGERDKKAQLQAGGDDRKKDDDGGHLIGTRFGGDSGSKNIDAQNSNANRGTYNKMEKRWADSIEKGDKVYAHVETFKSNGSERPDVYMGYTITEHDDKSREWEAFSVQNESAKVQEARNQEVAERSDLHKEYHNAMEYSAEEKKLCNEFADISSATGTKKQNAKKNPQNNKSNKGESKMAGKSQGSGSSGQSSSASQMSSASKSSSSQTQSANRGTSASQMSSASKTSTSQTQSANRSNSASQMSSASKNSGQGNNPYRTQGRSVSQTGYRSTSSMNRSQTSRNHNNNQKRGH